MRLIDGDALIKDIDYSADMGGALGKVVECIKYYAKYMIDSAPTIEERKTGRWIPCSERLPAYGEDVLISIGGYCNVGHIVSVNEEEQYNWYFSGWYHLPNDVDAWMPLPEPYRKGDD